MSPRLTNLLWIPVNGLQALWLAGFTALVFIPSLLPALVAGNREASFTFGRAFWAPVNLRLGLSTLTVEGREHLPAPGVPCVVMMNHQSMIDIIISWMVIDTGPRFVGKRVLGLIPIIGWFCHLMGMLMIDRSNRARAIASLKKANTVLNNGRMIVCFPEGTRTQDGLIMPFKKGVFMVALETGAPIVPVALEGCATMVPLTGWRPRPAAVRAKIGAPINTIGVDRDALIEKVRNAIIDLNVEIGGRGGNKSTPIAPQHDAHEHSEQATA